MMMGWEDVEVLNSEEEIRPEEFKGQNNEIEIICEVASDFAEKTPTDTTSEISA
jgi:hypothetical protein